MDQVAVLIPCFNEAQTIEKVVHDFREALPGAVIYVYDNNSTDDTARIAAASGAVVRHEGLQGKGNVMRRMFAEIDAQCYVIVDGDDTYPAASAPEMVRLVLEDKADMVVGDRLSSTYFEENKRLFHGLGNTLVRRAINLLFKSDIKDIMTGYRAFSYRFVKTFPVLSKGFEIETEMTIHAVDKNLLVKNVVIAYRDRPTGSTSKLNTYLDGFKVLLTIKRLFRTYRPGIYFGLISFFLFLLALIFIIPILVTFRQTGLVPRFPTLIVCGFVFITSVISFFSGQILQTINQKNRQDFELALYRVTDDLKKKMDARGEEKGKL